MQFFDRLFRRRHLDRTTEEEINFHLRMEIEAGLRRGLNQSAAERAARLKIGPIAAALDEVRDQRRLGRLEDWAIELRQAWTALRRRPGYLLLALGALASTVAVNTHVYTLLYGVLLLPLPYPNAERLARVYESNTVDPKFPLSIYHFHQNLEYSRTLEAQALYTRIDMQLTHDEHPEAVTAIAISDQFFPLLGGEPALGRNFRPEEMTGAARVVILSHTFWKNRVHADPAIVGRTLRIDRENWTVVGVAAEGFEHVGGQFRSTLQGDTVAIWRPLSMEVRNNCYRGCHYTNALVRLREGVTLAAAQQELEAILARMQREFPEFYAGDAVRLEPLASEVVGSSRTTVLVIASAGGCLLLLAAINVAGLCIARTVARRRELAVRAALGGGRAQMLRAELTENAVLGALAAALGLAFAAALLPALRALLPQDFPRAHEMILHWPAAVFAVVSAIGASLFAGLAAALRYANATPGEALQEDTRAASGSRRSIRFRGALVAAQMTLACVLCFAAILLLRSSIALGQRDPGFEPSGAVTFELAFPGNTYDGPRGPRMGAFYREAVRRLNEIPGVTAAGFGTSVPWTGYDENAGIEIPGYTPAPGEDSSARYQAASAEYFAALGAPIIAGRAIEVRDAINAPRAAVVNEVLVRRYFPDRSPLGREIDFYGQTWQIVGIVADIEDHPADPDAEPAVYMSLHQYAFNRIRGVVRTAGDPLEVLPTIRNVIADLDSEMPVSDIRTLASIAQDANSERRFTLLWCAAFAALALILGAVGIYSLLAYSVQQRTREIGIRLALGATRGRVLGTLIASGLTLAAAGLVAGLLAAPAAGRALASLLYGTSPSDLGALATAAGSILLAALLASIVPAWTAARTEPISVLRDQ
jgi:predicted permease